MEGFSLSSGRPQSEDEARKESTLIRQIILVCFYERFKTAAQKSTIALIHTDIDSNLFFTCPYRALTGDVAAKLRRFIGEDRSRVATEITEPIDKLMSEGWEVKGAGLMEPHAYTPYQIELDTDLRKLSIIPADPITEPPHETLETTSGLLQSVPKIMQYHGAAIAIEFDRLPSSAFDLYYALAVEESFAFSRIYVAENDPEAWTYVSADTKGSEVLVRE
jgi:hypothetical protein